MALFSPGDLRWTRDGHPALRRWMRVRLMRPLVGRAMWWVRRSDDDHEDDWFVVAESALFAERPAPPAPPSGVQPALFT